ncbi:MAG: hypothetical protein KDD55_00365 [Bdellovibrionales bacterium]|nr:hypothetical protein [Bdellovibrionales bacterium]
MSKVAELFKAPADAVTKGENDTFRLWEGYQEQASMWRIMAVAQLMTTPLLIILAIYLYATRSTILHVPAKPEPGIYAVSELQDSQFIATATEMVNLIASYQPLTARKQFIAAAEMVVEPALSKFKEDMLEIELNAIESTSRTQIFFVDPTKTTVERQGNNVTARLTGERLKLIGGKQVPTIITRFSITMTTNPRHRLNPNGIVVTNIIPENLSR